MDESQLEIEEFTSFNDFFTRRLRPEYRPQDLSPHTITAPADGRYTLLENLGSTRSIHVKGEALSLSQLLNSSHLAARFYGGSGVICRLCPADCHRFYFPVSGHATEATWINGSLFSVNPIATQTFPWIFWRNRRVVTLLETAGFGSIAYVEIGATNCGSISQTFVQNSWVRKGEEKGFFKLGGSAIILLFEPGQLRFADDLLELSKSGLEILCRIGQPLAHVSK
jgi:phosphatidylserine decarboxylase